MFDYDTRHMDGADAGPDEGYGYYCTDGTCDCYLDHRPQPLRTRERRRCYDCGPVLVGHMRRVIGHFVTQPRFDPTTAYRLACGHSTIDC